MSGNSAKIAEEVLSVNTVEISTIVRSVEGVKFVSMEERRTHAKSVGADPSVSTEFEGKVASSAGN